MHQYTLIRTRRKSLSLSVSRELEIIVRAPIRAPKRSIDAFVAAHGAWLDKHLQRMSTRAELRKEFTFTDGQLLYFMGKLYTIATREDLRIACISGDEIILPVENRAKAAQEFLRAAAKEYLDGRVKVYTPVMGVSPASVKITSAKTRWGSCSGKGSVCFSLRVMCLPVPLIDYIVVHELAHLKQHNHSPHFYAEIAAVLPDYRQREKQLREFAMGLPF